MRDLFHFDIETAGNYPTWDEFELNDQRGADLFRKKYDNYWIERYDTIEEAYTSLAPVVSTFGRICCISCGYWSGDEKRIRSSTSTTNDEKDILLDFKKTLEQIEVKNFDLTGFRIRYFDIPFVLHRMHKYDIKPPSILQIYDKKPWEMRVRDISDDWRQSFARAFSFDEVCYELDLESPKDEINGSEVHNEFWKQTPQSLERIKVYCEKDVSSSLDVERKMY